MHFVLLLCALAVVGYVVIISIYLILSGIPAAYLGTRVALLLPEGLVAKIFGLFLVSVGLSSLFGRNRAKKQQKT